MCRGLQQLHQALPPHPCLLLPPQTLFPWTCQVPPLPQECLRHPQSRTHTTQARSLITRVSETARFMFLAVNLTREMSTWVFLHPVATHRPDPFPNMGHPVFLWIPASHLLKLLFVMQIIIPLCPQWLVIIVHQ